MDSSDGFEALWRFVQEAAPLDTSTLQPFEGADVKWQKIIDAKESAEAKMFVRKEDDFPGLGGSKTNGGSAAPVEKSAGRAWGAGGGAWASRVVR